MIKSNGNTFQLIGKEYQYNFYVEDGKLYYAYYGAFLNDYYTRCEECSVAPPARDHFVGHSSSVLNATYTDLSDEYLLKEGKKLVW